MNPAKVKHTITLRIDRTLSVVGAQIGGNGAGSSNNAVLGGLIGRGGVLISFRCVKLRVPVHR